MQKSFIETQFPVSKISKESYKERKANLGQTLTGLGKWWGRKPLIMVRATILGLLMPSSDDPKKDHEIFLKILGMDDTGLLERKFKSIPVAALYSKSTKADKERFFTTSDKPTWKTGVSASDKAELQKSVFLRMGYDEKLTYCKRPEEMENIPPDSWKAINKHLGTTANSLQELTQQLSMKRYSELVTVGDCFSGGGSIPFEATRMGLNTYGSDLNPVAALLTWASLNINGANDDEVKKLREFQESVFNAVDKKITDWSIEHNEHGDRAITYLYCNETKCPACDWVVPMSPSWVVGHGTRTIATLLSDESKKRFEIEIQSGVSAQAINEANHSGTVGGEGMTCPHCHTTVPIASIRRDRRINSEPVSGLRQWKNTDFMPLPDDIFQERLYCIKYERSGNGRNERYYTAPTPEDLRREDKVNKLLTEYFTDWQEKGYLPSDTIESGYNTDQPIRERGWKYWHQLYNPRQLLLNGMFLKTIFDFDSSNEGKIASLLGVNKVADWNSKLCIWNSGAGVEKQVSTFSNQSLNTLFNYGASGIMNLKNIWFVKINNKQTNVKKYVEVNDARFIDVKSAIWITDPPYADAVNYHELSEYFLAWDKKLIEKTFPEWYTHSNRTHAVKGIGSLFAHAMIGVYKNLADHMPDDGMQVVMFTHQDPAVWAELSLILWSAGLQVTSAWNIATETESGGLKSGNYVKGTVLMVLRKNLSSKNGWLDDIYPQIKIEVKDQIESMRNLDSQDDPDFTDNDYLLAAYAASLKVLTSYSSIGDINIEYELARKRDKNTKSPVQEIIESAVKIAFDHLIPKGLSKNTWKDLTKDEKFYLKALEFERNGVYALSAYQELARGLGVNDYTFLLASTKANSARIKTPVELTNKILNNNVDFSNTLVRHVLMAVYVAAKAEDATVGKNWLRNELPNYWTNRIKVNEILDMIIAFENVTDVDHWVIPSQYAKYVKSLVENDGI